MPDTPRPDTPPADGPRSDDPRSNDPRSDDPRSDDAFDRLLVTSALPYANGPLHLGHLAGAYLPADAYVRYQRLAGRDVCYVCGSDEMGVAIMMRAMQEGTTAQAIVDRYHPLIEDSFRRFGMSFDRYDRTSAPIHAETSQAFFRTLDAQGDLVLQTEEQLFDPEAEMFLADRFVTGTCPVCGFPEAYGDQCEQCGSALSPTELIDPTSTVSGATPELRETTHWYLPLDRMQPALEAWIADHPEWKNNVLGQVKSWLAEGLKPRAITRDTSWGVPVPADVAARHDLNAEGKVIYVWFDAPIGYISATRAWAQAQGEPDAWRRYWQDEGTKLVHFIGKDNIVFHCLMFPAMLMAHGADEDAADGGASYVLPENVPANEFLNIEGRKLSTSRGWAVWLHEYLDDFAGVPHAPDLLRYALATTLPETKDADFSWDGFQARVNGELNDVLGNFVHRTLTFTARFFDGQVPPLEDARAVDTETLEALAAAPAAIAAKYEAFKVRDAVFETMNLARRGNKYFNDTEPWHTRKTSPAQAGNTLHVSLQLCAALSILMEPILPHAAAELRALLRLDGVRPSAPDASARAAAPSDDATGSDAPGSDATGSRDALGWADAGRPLLPAGHALAEGAAPLFAKIEDGQIEAQRAKLREAAAAQQAVAKTTAEAEALPDAPQVEDAPFAEVKDTIEFGDFTKLDLRTGEVTEAVPVPDADKLLRLQVDLGFETRQILAGVAQQMAPDDLVGRRVVVVANLAPKALFGFESQGMLLMAEDRAGRLIPIGAGDAEPGSVVR